jgi:glycosyltransferase involved in cell wall biosynthesis
LSTYQLKKDFSQLKSIIPKKLVPFSVIISARNEARNLIQYLPSILEQDYPTYEIIVIDDDSTDDTSKILNHFKGQYAHLHIIKIEHKKSAGKKEGLQQGIMNAKYEWLVFTDADCYPKSDQWLRKLASKCDEKTDIILGYSPYRMENGLLNDFIRYETFMTAVIYGTFTQIGMPYMGVGRNLAYRKSKFLEKVHKEKFEKISFGDDDLAVNAMATSHNTVLQFDEKASVISMPKTTFSDFIKQKTRHLAPSTHYKAGHQWLLGLLAMSQATFYPIIIFFCFLNFNLAAFIFFLRMMTVLPFQISLMNKMEAKDLRNKVILLDLLFFLYYWYISFKWLRTKNSSWN